MPTMGEVTELAMVEFKQWLANGDTTKALGYAGPTETTTEAPAAPSGAAAEPVVAPPEEGVAPTLSTGGNRWHRR